MSNARQEFDVRTIRSKLEQLIADRAGVTVEQSREFSFHMTDWLQDMEDLRQVLKEPDVVNDERLFSVLLRFLLHAPAHVVHAASIMTGETVEELLSDGSTK